MATTQSVIPMAVKPMDHCMEPRVNPQEAGLPDELKNKLKAPLPEAAIKAHPRISGLSSINAAFVIERMNEVFGPGGYQEKYREIQIGSRDEVCNRGTEKERTRKLHVATVHGTLSIPKYNIHIENFGGSDNEDLGDAFKGACTDAFTKACSHLGIGLDVYMSGREAASAGEDRPACPQCGKPLFKNKPEDGPGYYCWKKKEGCGATFSEEGLKAAMASKNGHAKAPQRTDREPQHSFDDVELNKRPPRPQPAQGGKQAQPIDRHAGKFALKGTVLDRHSQRDGANNTLWLLVKAADGEYPCVTKLPDIMNCLTKAYKGDVVEMLVTQLSGKKGPIYQIREVIAVRPRGDA